MMGYAADDTDAIAAARELLRRRAPHADGSIRDERGIRCFPLDRERVLATPATVSADTKVCLRCHPFCCKCKGAPEPRNEAEARLSRVNRAIVETEALLAVGDKMIADGGALVSALPREPPS
jgi:hypothetical protein